MLFGTDRQLMRQVYFDAWQKYKTQVALDAFEQQIVNVILQHPEYQPIFDNPKMNLDREFFPEIDEINPFLHLSLHVAILEQVSTDRPAGVKTIYQKLMQKYGDSLVVEHQMLEVLGTALWEMQQGIKVFDEDVYLERLRGLL